MSDPEYVAIEHAGRVTGVPARTLRRWAEAGKVPVIAGQRKRLVRLEDVRRMAIMTGHRPDPVEMSGTSAGQTTGHVATDVADDNMPAASAITTTPQAYLDEIRDQWLQPLIDQLRDAERTIGRLEAERDQAAHERDALQTELTTIRETTLQESHTGAVRDDSPSEVAIVPTPHEDALQGVRVSPRNGEAGTWVWEAIGDRPAEAREGLIGRLRRLLGR